jgi:Cys-tRNA(Pro)/Cys-tRNA(Cys) deacylase
VTPAIIAARRAGVAHEVLAYRHDPAVAAYGLEAAHALGLEPESVYKTLVVESGPRAWALGLVAVDTQLDLKAMATALGVRRVDMADPQVAERLTGYVVGGISPLGQRRRLPTVIDERVMLLPRVHVSAGRRGLEIALAPADLVAATGATLATLARASG